MVICWRWTTHQSIDFQFSLICQSILSINQQSQSFIVQVRTNWIIIKARLRINFICIVNNRHQRQPSLSNYQSINMKKQSFSASKAPSNTNPHKTTASTITLKQKLLTFLTKASEIERKLEIVKETLCQEETFTPESVFHRIDTQRKGYVLQKDLQRFLNDNKIEYKGSELKILFGKMNAELSDHGVFLWEFQNFILPNQNPRLRYLTMRRPVYIPLPDERLPQKIEWLISKLFFEIMKQEAKLKEINAALISSYDFSPASVFNLLANLEGFITGQSLNNFLFKENCELSIEEIGCLIRLIDKHGQGHICLDDLKFFLATMRLKKQHQIFDQLSPIPALKNFVAPLIESIHNREGTLKERVINNKMNGRSPQKTFYSSAKKKRSQNNSNLKRNH